MDLTDIRAQIDDVDNQIIELFARRMDLIEDVARAKMESGAPILDEGREREKLDRVAANAPADLKDQAVELLRVLMSMSRERQRAVMEHPAKRPYGVLGRVLGHSYTPVIYRELAGLDYRTFEREPEQIEEFVRSGAWEGFNVTIPYKRDLVPYMDELSPVARRMGNIPTGVQLIASAASA